MLLRVWRKGNLCALLVGMDIGATTEENIWKFLTKLKIELPYDPVIPLLVIYLEKKKTTDLERYMPPNVHSSTVYNSRDMETT